MENNYLMVAKKYLYAVSLLKAAYEKEQIDIFSEECAPLFHLLGHSCECLLKQILISKKGYSEKDVKNFRHDLIKMNEILEDFLSEDLKDLIFWIANNYYISPEKGGGVSSYPDRYNDYNFSSTILISLQKKLIEKQKSIGLMEDSPYESKSLTNEQIEKLNPEYKKYWDYLRGSFRGRPKVDYFLPILEREIIILEKEKNIA